jgi:GNAT superfamily N-acetyltransferase
MKYYLSNCAILTKRWCKDRIETDYNNPGDWIVDKKSHLWIASIGDKIAGVVGVVPYKEDPGFPEIKVKGKKTAELKRMHVCEEFRKHGIARKLYSTLEEFCITNGYDEILLSTTDFSESALIFYEKIGFKFVLRYNFTFWFPRINFMVKHLTCKKEE